MSHPGIIPLSEARDLLILDCESRRLAPATRHYYAKKTGYFIRWLADENIHHVHEVAPTHIRRYLASIEERGLFRRLQKASGVKHCKAHTFRRTFAITCLRNGMNVYVLARLMGHADISVLRHYLAIVEEDLEGAHARFGAVDGMNRG